MDREERDMTEPELRKYFAELATKLEGELPPGPSKRGKCLFVLLVCDSTEPGVSQYVSNARREDIIKLLRETASVLAKRQDVPR